MVRKWLSFKVSNDLKTVRHKEKTALCSSKWMQTGQKHIRQNGHKDGLLEWSKEMKFSYQALILLSMWSVDTNSLISHRSQRHKQTELRVERCFYNQCLWVYLYSYKKVNALLLYPWFNNVGCQEKSSNTLHKLSARSKWIKRNLLVVLQVFYTIQGHAKRPVFVSAKW